MENAVTVKKNINQRYGIRFLAFLYLIASLLALYLWEFSLLIALILLLPGIPLLVLLLYFETWKITFDVKQIVQYACFHQTGPYSYEQISSAVSGHSHTLNTYVRITFCDGKTFSFRMEDENARKATTTLSKRHSIRTIQ